MAWRRGGDTGLSSLTIWCVLMGYPTSVVMGRRSGSVPYDPADFGRCLRLIRRIPSWRRRLPEVATAFPIWAPFVREWDRMAALYDEEEPSGRAPRLYDFMQDLLVEACLR